MGYLVPEFPGQTHIFLWRELHSLAGLGVECQIVSTRLPAKKIISHSWSESAMHKTTYLSPPAFGLAVAGALQILQSGPPGWWRLLSALVRSEGKGLKMKLRMLGLAVVGGQLAALAKRGNWQHVHVHSCADSANVALFAHLISGLTYSITLHGPLEDYGANQPMKWRHADFAVVITRKLFGEVHAALGTSLPHSLEIAPMGVDTTCLRRAVPFKPFDGNGTFEIFSCGRLNLCKGHDDLIRATALLKNSGVNVRLRIAGADDSQGKCQSMLENLISQLLLDGSVILLGAVPENVVKEGLESSHVFALASLHEPLGVAIMEAMAMEMPVIATNAGGVPELIDDGIDGLLVPPRDPVALAGALHRVIGDPELAESLASAARKKVVAFFQSDQSARVLHKHLYLKSQASGHGSSDSQKNAE